MITILLLLPLSCFVLKSFLLYLMPCLLSSSWIGLIWSMCTKYTRCTLINCTLFSYLMLCQLTINILFILTSKVILCWKWFYFSLHFCSFHLTGLNRDFLFFDADHYVHLLLYFVCIFFSFSYVSVLNRVDAIKQNKKIKYSAVERIKHTHIEVEPF